MSLQNRRLGDLVEINPNLPRDAPPQEPAAFVPMAALDAESATVLVEDSRPIEKMANGFSYFQSSDILVAKITPCFQNGKIAEAIVPTRHAFGSTEFHVLRPKQDRLVGRYLMHFLRQGWVLQEGERKMTGSAGQRRVPKHFLESLEIPTPSLPEQRRIAAILDQAEALRTKRRAALAKLDTLAQSIFIEMFGDPANNPNKWPRVSLAQTCQSGDDIKCGPFGTQLTKAEFRAEGVPLWGIRHVNKNFEFPTNEFLDPKTANRLSQYSIEPNDIVMTRKGTIGNCCVYPENFPFGIMHSDLLRLRVDRRRTEPAFLAHQLHHSPDVEHQISLFSGGAVMPGINVGRLKLIEVLNPPIQLQQQFTSRLRSIHGLRGQSRFSELSLDTLFASLQHRAFRGKL